MYDGAESFSRRIAFVYPDDKKIAVNRFGNEVDDYEGINQKGYLIEEEYADFCENNREFDL